MQPDSGFHGLEGMKHMPTAIVPGYTIPTWRRTDDDRHRGGAGDDAGASAL